MKRFFLVVALLVGLVGPIYPAELSVQGYYGTFTGTTSVGTALISDSNGVVWNSSDGAWPGQTDPTAWTDLSMVNGLWTYTLGDISFQNMSGLPNGTITDNLDLSCRIWVGTVLQTPDVDLTDAPYAILSYNPAIYAQLSDFTEQTFAATGTAQSILLASNDGISGITHSTSSNTENITIETAGVYSFGADSQIIAGAGASGYFHLWLQKDAGAGFTDLTNSTADETLSSNQEDVLSLSYSTRCNEGDVIRVRASVGDIGIELEPQTPAVGPAIPSIMLEINYVGR